MGSSRLLIFFILPVLLVLDPLVPAIADDQDSHTVCRETADYCWSCSNTNNTINNGSIFKQNLNSLLTSFPSNAQINSRFYNFSLGQAPNTGNAIAVCRGDVALKDCLTCFKDSVSILLQNCTSTNEQEAIIWAERCTVRYSTVSILGVLEDEPFLYLTSPHNVSNTELYNQVLNPLFKNLSEKAAAGDSLSKFAAGHALVPVTNQTIYATVQCSPDLDKQNCSNCLEESISDIRKCCGGVEGARVLKPSCYLRFESNPFYEPGADTLINLPGEQGNNTSGNNTSGNNTSNITTKVSPLSFFRLLLSLGFFISICILVRVWKRRRARKFIQFCFITNWNLTRALFVCKFLNLSRPM